ncbi:coiled-coil domain-containing protein 180 isoform X3 [Hydra vulgaris]|uniref:coiled-coil domain-containing protein 180 isoform X3 n=1 Tax=Hydra vulgaris TaxID=6087 RepID=UPI001F5EA7E0|nr:coiled-coil domain-containing protein 180 isoform X3 [Hydra vulgaris]
MFILKHFIKLHDDVIEVMNQELAFISLELESHVEDACKSTKSYLDNNTEDIDSILDRIRDNENLMKLSMNNLKMLWNLIEKHSVKRSMRINQLGESLENIEINRAKLVTDMLHTCCKKLNGIAYIKPVEVYKLLEDKAMEINMSILQNHKSYTELIGRLLTVDVEKENNQKIFWENKVKVWKNTKLSAITEMHKDFMSSESIINSPIISSYLEKLLYEQESFNVKRLNILDQLREIVPPFCSETAVYQWSHDVTLATQNIDNVQNKYKSLIQQEQQNILCLCEDYITKTKNELVKEEIVNETNIEELANNIFYPLLWERKALFSKQLEKLESCILNASAKHKQNLSLLFEYVHGAAHIWSNHESEVCEKKQRLQQYLDGNRQRHDKENKAKECMLDTILDKMRQGSTNEMLAESLKQTIELLEFIKKSYYEFHKQQQTICERFPKMYIKELNKYSSEICAYFGVDISEDSGNFLNDFSEICQKNMNPNFEYFSGVIENNLSFDNISLVSNQPGDNQDFNLAEQQCHFNVQPYIKSFEIPTKVFAELKSWFFTKFMENLKNLKENSKDHALLHMNEKILEIDNELEFRLQLHNPRQNNCKKDIHDVRTAELSAHSARVSEHNTAVIESIALVKRKVQEVLYNPKKQRDLFLSSMDNLEESLSKVAHINEFNQVQVKCIERLNQVSQIISKSISELRTECINILNKSRSANTEFCNSMRLFSEGGNFSYDETVALKKKLAKMVRKMNLSESKVIKKLDLLEQRREGFAKEFAQCFQERFSYHFADVSFVEKTKCSLRGIQLKIKSEMAKCSSQGINVKEKILAFGQQIESFNKKPTAETDLLKVEIHKVLPSLFLSIQERINYLDYFNKTKETNNNISMVSSQETKQLSSDYNSSSLSQSIALEKTTNNRDFKLIPYTPSETEVIITECKKIFLTINKDSQEKKTQFYSEVAYLLQTGLDELLLSAELYYRQRAQRPSTRQKDIKETFEECATLFIQKLKNFREQADKFAFSCVQELQSQVCFFMIYARMLPELFVQSLYSTQKVEFIKGEELIKNSFLKKQDINTNLRREHQTLLRPTLGHPNNETEMRKLCDSELKRQNENLKTIDNYHHSIEGSIKLHVKSFVSRFQDIIVILLKQFDEAVNLEIIAAAVKTKTEKELLKENLIKSKHKQSNKGLDVEIMNYFYCDNNDKKLAIPQTTSVHELVTKSRDKIFKKIYEELTIKQHEVDEMCCRLRSDEEMWIKNWNSSVKKIKDLY